MGRFGNPNALKIVQFTAIFILFAMIVNRLKLCTASKVSYKFSATLHLNKSIWRAAHSGALDLLS